MMLDIELPEGEALLGMGSSTLFRPGSCMNVTESIQKLTEMDSPHEDQKWEDMFKDMELFDDVINGKKLNKA